MEEVLWKNVTGSLKRPNEEAVLLDYPALMSLKKSWRSWLIGNCHVWKWNTSSAEIENRTKSCLTSADHGCHAHGGLLAQSTQKTLWYIIGLHEYSWCAMNDHPVVSYLQYPVISWACWQLST